jgi:NADPH:quinone reductase-like Zn-dependent oxidoreductase
MQAIYLFRYGGPEVLELGQVPDPMPLTNEVLVRVHATALNPLDLELRKGRMRWLTGNKLPVVPGYDFAGVIEELGPGVKSWRKGEAVYGMTRTRRAGAYAELLTIKAVELGRMPAGLTFAEAAAMPLAALTALQALRDLARLQPGQSVLINGASGGVGVFAVQLARAMGARVVAICSHRNQEMVEALGAHEVVDYTQTNYLKLSERFDLFFDVYGNQSYRSTRHMLLPDGQYISTIPSPVNFLWQGLTAFNRRRARVVVVRGNLPDLTYLRQLVEEGKLQPVVDRIHPLAEAAEAQRYLHTRRAKGKVVLTLTPQAEQVPGIIVR